MKLQKESLTSGIGKIEFIVLKIVIFVLFLKECYDFLVFSFH